MDRHSSDARGPHAVTTSNLDTFRTANLLVQQYGPNEAPIIAAKRADALLSLGDLDGQRVWKGGNPPPSTAG